MTDERSKSPELEPAFLRQEGTVHLSEKLTDYYNDIPQTTLKFHQTKVGELNVGEGTLTFAFWFCVSTYLPLFTACVCPLTNMASIAALATTWRYVDAGTDVEDPILVYRLNAISLGFGAVANFSVFFNFNRVLNYKLSQVISILGFFVSSILLLAGILILHKDYMQPQYTYAEGFWYGVATCAFYAICSASCFLNFLGYLLGKYPPDFNLDRSERALIIYTFLLAVWFSWGSALFSYLMSISYATGLYFCVQSLLTIGMGDVSPDTNLSKGLAIVYSFSGFIILGLIVVMIRSTIVSANIPVLFWNEVELRRKRALRKVLKNKVELSQRDSFDLMRSVRKSARRHQSNISTCISIFVWVSFWFIGSLVFYCTEDWTYFNSVYFCFVSWLTIGYGNPAPRSAAGRTFFVFWTLAAVPLMTVLISDLADRMFEISNNERTSAFLKKFFNRNKKQRKQEQILDFAHRDLERDIDEDEQRSVDEIISNAASRQKKTSYKEKQMKQAQDIVKNVRKLITETKKSPQKRYEYEYWRTIVDLMDLEEQEKESLGINDGNFWLSEDSPLRFPINEPDYLLYFLFDKLEELIFEKIERLSRYEEDDTLYRELMKKSK